MKLADLFKETRKVKVDIAGSALEVEYYVNAYTPEVEALVTGDVQRPARVMAELLARLVASWTLEDDDGKMYPVNAEAMNKLPLMFMLKVFQAIAEDMRPNLETAGS